MAAYPENKGEFSKIEKQVDDLADKHRGLASKQMRNEGLRAIGIDLSTGHGNRMIQRFQNRTQEHLDKIAKDRSEREKKRIAPYIDEAKDLLRDDEELDDGDVVKMATSLADEADEQAEKERSEKEAEDNALAEYLEKRHAVEAQGRAIEKSLGEKLVAGEEGGIKLHGLRASSGGSLYGHFHGLKIRVSDHPHVIGGGFNQGTGERMGEPDVDFVVTRPDHVISDAKVIRRRIAEALKKRNEEGDEYSAESHVSLELLKQRIFINQFTTFASEDAHGRLHADAGDKGRKRRRPYLPSKRRTFAGIDVEIENPVGSVRSGKDRLGKPWRVTMKHAYGFIERATGSDGEGLDVFLGDDPKARNAYVIHQNDPHTGRYDEDKVVLGAGSPEAAKSLYLANYNTPKFYRSTTIIPIESFRKMLTSAEPGSVHWKRKRGRALDDAAMFDANDKGELQWRTLGAEGPDEEGKKHGGSPHLIRSSDGMIMDEKDGKPGKLAGITVKELKGEGSPARELPKEEDRVPSKTEESKHVQEQPSEPERTGSDRGRPEHGGVDGGSDRGTGGQEAQRKGRIVTARAELTKPANTELVPEGLRQYLDDHQQQGVAKAIEAMDKHGGFLNADSTGVGKTRQQLAVAKKYADQGKKVLIVTKAEVVKPDWKKKSISGSFKQDSENMGVPLTLNDGESPLITGQVHLTTFDRLKDIKDRVDPDTVLLFDESHALKNSASARTKHAFEMMKRANKVMYSTATPADKPLHIAHLFRAGVFGGKKSAETYEKLGLIKKEINTPHGTISKWEVNPRVGNAEVLRRLSGLQDKMTEEGLMIRREISLDGVDVGIDRIKLPQECHDAMQQIEDNVRATSGAGEGLTRALVLMQQRRQQEQYKIPHIVAGVQKELAEGRKAIVFVSRVNESTVDGEEGDEESAVSSEGTAKLLREALEKAGVGNIVELHGGITKGQRQKSMDKFQDGPAQVMVATIESGGTGINLDDSKGDSPRTLFMMTAPFSAVENVQAAGRVHRLKTKSLPRIRYVFGDTEVDDWNSALIAKKMRTLGAAVGGEVGKLDVMAPKGAEHLGEHKEPFAWHSLTGGMGEPRCLPLAEFLTTPHRDEVRCSPRPFFRTR